MSWNNAPLRFFRRDAARRDLQATDVVESGADPFGSAGDHVTVPPVSSDCDADFGSGMVLARYSSDVLSGAPRGKSSRGGGRYPFTERLGIALGCSGCGTYMKWGDSGGMLLPYDWLVLKVHEIGFRN